MAKFFGKKDTFYCTRSVHEELEVDPSDPGIAGVVAHVPRPQLAADSDQDPGGQVVELDPHHGAASSWVKVKEKIDDDALLSSNSNLPLVGFLQKSYNNHFC